MNMKLPKNGSEHVAGLILSGLFLGVIAITGSLLLLKNLKPAKMPIEQALWVSDWEIENFYGPGIPEQQRIVEQLSKHMGDNLEFEEHVIYRMGVTAADSSEGVLIYGFDPERSEMARQLAAQYSEMK